MNPDRVALPAVAVGVMDRDGWDANTDILAVVDPVRRRVVSIPRDVWSEAVDFRINFAWAKGGPDLLRRALAELGFQVDEAVCFQRSAVSRVLDTVDVTVPVDQRRAYMYPADPLTDLRFNPAVVARFDPPSERLTGIRVHQWIGARYPLVGPSGDLDRMRRQQILVKAMLDQGVDWSAFVADPDGHVATSRRAFDTLRTVRSDWRFEAFEKIVPVTIRGAHVFLRATPGRRLRRGVRSLARFMVRAAILRGGARLPTGGLRRPPRRVRLLAVVAARNEERYLPGLLANVAPHVDGVVALDDGSTDGTRAILEAHPKVLEVLDPAPDRDRWDEVENHRRLVRAALDHGAEWIIALDADERVEIGFRDRVERAIARGRRLGLTAYSTPMHELWDRPDRWRADGPWRRKRPPRLFAARPDHGFDPRPLHGSKAPEQGQRAGLYIPADVRLYHLRMIEAADRDARRRRYEELDPDHLFQQEGYAYLTDLSGIRLRRVPRRRRPTHT